MGTKNNPGEYDCYQKAEPDEPMFVLLGRDPTASVVVAFWRALNLRLGLAPAKDAEALTCQRAMAAWARAAGKDLEAVLRAASGAGRPYEAPAIIASEPAPTVHLLMAGVAVCGAGVPQAWGLSDRWVAIDNTELHDQVNCLPCRATLP